MQRPKQAVTLTLQAKLDFSATFFRHNSQTWKPSAFTVAFSLQSCLGGPLRRPCCCLSRAYFYNFRCVSQVLKTIYWTILSPTNTIADVICLDPWRCWWLRIWLLLQLSHFPCTGYVVFLQHLKSLHRLMNMFLFHPFVSHLVSDRCLLYTGIHSIYRPLARRSPAAVVVAILLLICGVEVNPGPEDITSKQFEWVCSFLTANHHKKAI